jgi:uncharacterized protein YkwD
MKAMKPEKRIPKRSKRLGIIAGVIIIILSTFLTLRSELSNISQWLSPVAITEPPKAAVERVKPTTDALLNAVNKVRADAGVSPLTIDDNLNLSAQAKADDMKARNYFGHVDPDGRHGYSIAREYAPECKSISENMTYNIDINTTEQAVHAWTQSPSHYNAMVDTKYTVTGFGIADRYIVEHFCEI